MWGHGDWPSVFPDDSSIYKSFSALPPGNARLEIHDSFGNVLSTRALDTPLAKLEEWSPAGKSNWGYLLTQDYSIGMGSYNGPGTTLVQVIGTAFQSVTALNAITHQEEPISLGKTLKQDWRITTGEKGTEILAVSCHPGFAGNNDSFVIKYTRYSFDGLHWTKFMRQQNGTWESDNSFPPRSAFP
jgi:hypothetical protein